MRTRTRNNIVKSYSWAGATCDFVIRRCNLTTQPGSQSFGAVNVPIEAFYERIDDTTGRGRANQVKHRRMDVRISDAVFERRAPHTGPTDLGVATFSGAGPSRPGSVYALTPDWRNWTLVGPDWFSPNPHRWNIVAPPHNESNIKNDLIERARGLKADVLLNAVEANQIWPSVRSLASCIPEMARNWKKLRKVIRTASGSYLAWKFGVSPILSDVMNVVRYLPKLGSDIDAHIKQDARRYSKVLTGKAYYDSSDLVRVIANTYPCYVTGSQGVVATPPTVRYVLVVEPEVKYQTEFFSGLDACLRRFATSPASLAWELKSFSFVADWFVDLRGTLSAVDKMLGFSPYKIRSFTRSYKYEVGSQLFDIRRSPCDGAYIENTPCAWIDYKHYERIPVSQSALPTWAPRFGKNQAGVTAALIAQKLSQLRR